MVAGELGFAGRPDAPHARHRQRREEACDRVGVVVGIPGDDGEPVGLFEVGRELGEELVGRDADGAGELGFLLDESADLLPDVHG